MTGKQIIKIIKENNLIKALFSEYRLEDYMYDNDLKNDEALNEHFSSLGLPYLEIVEEVCNSDIMYTIVKFGDIYLKLTGEYDSYGGGDHYYDNEITQVFPQEITTTIYK